ncbi:MAG: O-antigen ligase family protein [Deltaproteobacteria bacterium]|nr:O-antigen ligase family protein [Deltaproteobacteria bacterium]MBW2661848.1 O-antigen ligase family protein [Deltaproteobacteria bacterium]
MIQDVIMISMLGAVFLKLFFPAREKPLQNKLGLSLFVVLFGLWILFEIARNVGMYGLSAPGEFRFRYLILSVPLYVCFFFAQEEDRKKLFKILIAATLFFPIMCVPIIAHLKGWSVGAVSRFFPSSISLGLLYGVIALSVGQKYDLVRINGAIYWFMIASVGLLILLDTHRSVWLAATVTAITLSIMKEIPYRKIMTWLLLIIISGVIVYTVASKFIMPSTGTTPVNFVLKRSSDIVKFSEGHKNTAAWRVAQWKMQMQKFYAAPIAGQGFGGYWGLSGKLGDLGVSPHSLYVQTLVKLGIVGMFLYLIIVLKIFDKLRRIIARYKVEGDPEMAILITGLVVLIASHVFYTIYAFEYYSLLFIGLSVASLRDEKFTIYA